MIVSMFGTVRATVRIDEIIASSDGPVFSFEFFPPKTDEGERNLRLALEDLRAFDPDFVSVTYGAGGSDRDRTFGLTRWIKQELGIEAMSHLSCVGASPRGAAGDPRRDPGERDRQRAGAARRRPEGRAPTGRRTPAGCATRPSSRR